MQPLHQQVSSFLEAERENIANAIIERQWALHPEFTHRYGEAGRAKCLQDVKYNLTYLAEAIAVESPPLFAEYMGWVKVLFAGLKIPIEELSENITIMRGLLQQRLSQEMGAIVDEYIEAGLQQLPRHPVTLPSYLKEKQPLASLAQQYLAALLDGNRYQANQLILDAVKDGVSVKDIYLYVFQQSQREIGRLWQMNQISVAQEHYCTAATQLIMSQLYPYIFTTDKINRRLVATCIGGELHELGVRMVADFFEMAGWDTYYLGANTPTKSILDTISERKANVLAISATMTFHVRATEDLIEQIRKSEAGQQIKILVGGYPFNLDPDLWRRVGASGYAPDAQEAVTVANRLVNNGAQP